MQWRHCNLTLRHIMSTTVVASLPAEQEPAWSADLSKFGIPYVDADGASQFFVDYW